MDVKKVTHTGFLHEDCKELDNPVSLNQKRKGYDHLLLKFTLKVSTRTSRNSTCLDLETVSASQISSGPI